MCGTAQSGKWFWNISRNRIKQQLSTDFVVEENEESYWLNVKLESELHRSEFALEIISSMESTNKSACRG